MTNRTFSILQKGRKLTITVGNRKLSPVDMEKIRKPLCLASNVEDVFDKNQLLGRFELEGRRFIVYVQNNNLYISTWIDVYYRPHTRFIPFITKNRMIFIGTMHHESNQDYRELDSVKISEYTTKIKRPFSRVYGLRRFAFFSIDLQKAVFSSHKMHQLIQIMDSQGFTMPVRTLRFLKSSNKTPIILRRRLIGRDFIIALRTVEQSNRIMLSRSPYDDLYKISNVWKNRIAFLLSHISQEKKVNLLFEKECARAEESGFFVFTKLYEEKNLKSRNYFVISKDSEDYSRIKKTYGKYIIAKYSFRHFFFTYTSNYLISSELSFHLFNPRIYINTLRRVIATKPLIFLQHGIMFAKPVENPAARGFYKGNSEINIYRSVISSELEATQFYKMGYSRKELIKCGLPKFDMRRDTKRDKIVFMPTYRYWEEGLVNAGRIEETTYYQTVKEVLETFKNAKMLEDFIVTSHPKFSDYIGEMFPDFKENMEPNTTKAVESAAVFITDFSSASYDAHLGGAYPIYYWEERAYLEENYQAKSALTKRNADGPDVYSKSGLVDEVKKAISRNYILESKYETRYKKINEFNDGKNTDRLIKYLKRSQII